MTATVPLERQTSFVLESAKLALVVVSGRGRRVISVMTVRLHFAGVQANWGLSEDAPRSKCVEVCLPE